MFAMFRSWLILRRFFVGTINGTGAGVNRIGPAVAMYAICRRQNKLRVAFNLCCELSRRVDWRLHELSWIFSLAFSGPGGVALVRLRR
jgi:hypothetical protein